MATRPMQVWNGTAWEDIGPQAPPTAIVVQSSTPTGDSGKLWIDTSADVPTYANMAPTASPSFTGTSTFAGPVTMSGGAVNMSGATSVTGGGMDLITPTSVAGTGVTLSGGQVTFTAATSVSVNGCFSATYDNYLISVRNSWASTTGQPYLDLRLRLSGSDASAANYSYVLTQAFTSIAVDTSAFGATVAHITRAGDVNDGLGGGNVSVFAPFLAQRTSVVSDISIPYSNTSMKRTLAGGDHSLSTSYDGFSFIPSASTITGTLRVYGLRNS